MLFVPGTCIVIFTPDSIIYAYLSMPLYFFDDYWQYHFNCSTYVGAAEYSQAEFFAIK